jgi:hypothetical protein
VLGFMDQPERQTDGHQERQGDSGHAGVPAELVEELAKYRAADQASGKVAAR